MKKSYKFLLFAITALLGLTLAACDADDAPELEFQTSNDYLQWRFEDDDEWSDLIAMDDIRGADGQDGTDGQDGEDGAAGTDGEDGEDGEDGVDGLDAFELYLDNYPGYDGDVKDWFIDINDGTLSFDIELLWADGYTETHTMMKGETVDTLDVADFDWYLDDEFSDSFTGDYVMEAVTLYTDAGYYVDVVEEDFFNDGIEFNDDDMPNDFLQYVAHVVWNFDGDLEVVFEDTTEDEIIHDLSLDDQDAGYEWFEMRYLYTDSEGTLQTMAAHDNVIPIGNDLRLTLTFTNEDDEEFVYVSEFEMTETMHEYALNLLNVQEVVDNDDFDTVATKGIVTAIPEAGTFYIEDEYGAIAVYEPDEDYIPDLNVGDEIFIRGSRSAAWFGLEQIGWIDNILVLDTDQTLPPSVDLGYLAEDMVPYQGHRLNIDELIVQSDVEDEEVDSSFNVALLDPISGQTIQIRYSAYLDDQDIVDYLNTLEEGDVVDVNDMVLSWFRGPQFFITHIDQIDDSELTETTINAYFERELAPQEEIQSDSIDLVETYTLTGVEYTIVWTSSDEVIINPTDGTVTRPDFGEGNVDVTLSPAVTDGNDFSENYDYTVTVFEEPGDIDFDYLVDFDFVDSTSTSYTTSIQHTDDDGFEWDLLGRPGNADGFGLGNESDGSFIEVQANGGIAALKIDAVRMFTNSNTRSFEVFVNGESQGEFTVDPESDDVQTFEIYQIYEERSFTLRIESTSPGSRGAFDIHSIEWAPFGDQQENDVVETAIAHDDFDILVDALTEANLVDALQAMGPFTVFAPNDEAFNTLLTELDITKADLLADEDLADLLLYHVIPGDFTAEDVLELTSEEAVEVETLNGENITISVIGEDVLINGVKVLTTDILASNGVIHVLEEVLELPEESVEVQTVTQSFDDVTSEGGYNNGTFVGEEGYEWTYHDFLQETNSGRLNNDGYLEVTLENGLDEVIVEFTRPSFDAVVEVDVLVDDQSIGSLVYDGDDSEFTTLTLSDLDHTGTLVLKIDAAQGRPLVSSITFTTNPAAN